MRKVPFLEGQYYHIYNRGTDKRIIFNNIFDLQRFVQSMEEFNTLEPIGSIYWNTYIRKNNFFSAPSTKKSNEERLVDFVAYCLNPNHYHLILTPLVENGIEKFMQKLGAGFTRYYNERYKRSGALFQGRFKAVHIDSDSYLLHLSVYVNLNDRVHFFSAPSTKLISKSSWGEYIGENNENFCNKEMILSKFDSKAEYKKFAEETLEGIIERKKEMKEYFLE